MADKEYYSFEEVLKDLKLEEDELKRLVSAGEIRAFRDKNTMRFKAEDVDRLRGESGGDLELDDLELELEDAPPAPAAPARSLRPAAPVPAAPVDDLDLETAGTVEEIELEESAPVPGAADPDSSAELAAEAVAATAAARSRPARGAAATRRGGRAPAEAVEEGKEGVGVLAMLIVGTLILVCATFVVLDAVLGQSSNPLSRAVADMFS